MKKGIHPAKQSILLIHNIGSGLYIRSILKINRLLAEYEIYEHKIYNRSIDASVKQREKIKKKLKKFNLG
jgi:ribosomal protein L31